jgi:prepilin peptidase CpaA
MSPYWLFLLTAALKVAISGLLVLAAVRDVMTRTVPNWMPMTLAIFAAVLALFDLRFFWGLCFGITIFLFSLFCWWRGWMGGADVKLLGAAGIAVTPTAIGTFLLAVSLSGGVLATIYLAGRFVLPRFPLPQVRRRQARRSWHILPRALRVEAWRIRHRGKLPYACAIAAGTIFVLS